MKKYWLSGCGKLRFAWMALLLGCLPSSAVAQQDSLAGSLTDDGRLRERTTGKEEGGSTVRGT
jgi:hypothetical protein